MTTRICGLYWDEPDPGLVILQSLPHAQCLVIWPTPIDADACFAEAGFREFADSGAEWDADFGGLAELLFQTVARVAGTPQPAPPPEPVSGLARLWRRPPLPRTPLATLLDAAEDDSLGPATVLFGNPATAALTTADGHPLWWLHILPSASALPDQVRAACSEAFSLHRRSLPWAGLSPFRRGVG